MRGILENLNMFFLDYIIVPVWMVFSVLGNMKSAKIMIPITIVFILLNYFSTRKATKLFLLDINLAAASIAGIILNSFLYLRFVYADPETVTDMAVIIFGYTLFIITGCMICLLFKSVMHRRNMRIINRMAYGPYDDVDDMDIYDDEEEDEDDEDDEEEEIDAGKRRSFLSSIQGLLGSSDEEDEEEEDGDEEEDEYEKPDGPKFRVVKK